jgi:hypothetical protein
MKPACEIMVQRVLPAIRAVLARELMNEHKCTQQQVANLLGLSRAAVSQYVSEKRGAEVGFSENTNEEIRKFACCLAEDGLTPKQKVKRMCEVCKHVQKSGWLYKNAPEVGYCILCGDDD